MIYGEQWSCGCGWSNFFLRRKCRNCGLPSSLAVGGQTAAEVVDARHAGAARTAGDVPGRDDAKRS